MSSTEASSSSDILPAASFITTSERFYLYVRQFAVKSIFDAGVELITNSNDAYTRMNADLTAAGQPLNTNKSYVIDYHANTNTIIFTDHAIGVSGTDMPKMFLQIGNYSSTSNTRGFFSRGAKDVSILGDVAFKSIKNGLYSACTLSTSAYGAMVAVDVPVTDDHRNTLNIPVNGTAVSIALLPQFSITDEAKFPIYLSKIAVLRNIMADKTNTITFRYFNADNVMSPEVRLGYTYPDSKPLLNMTYTVPGYPDATATFIVNQTATKIPQPEDNRVLEFGFLLESATSIYEVNTIQARFRYHPYISYVFGSLTCDYIAWLMYDIDTNGSSAKNPMIIIDPSRSSGLNESHPFTQALYGIVAKRLDLILQELDTALSNGGVILKDFSQIVKEIQNFGAEFLGGAVNNLGFTPNYKSNLIKAIQDDRSQYVQVEQNYQPNTLDPSSITPSAYDALDGFDLSQNWIYIVDSNNSVIKIPSNGINPLSPDITSEQMAELANGIRQNINPDDFSKNPYIYAMDDSGDMVKLFIYQNGTLDDYTGAENSIVPEAANALNIIFTNDLNINYQYSVTHANGAILVKININDPLIKQYIATDTIVSGEATSMTNTSKIANNNGYIFLSGMFTEMFARIMVEFAIRKGTIPNVTDYYSMQHEYQTMANLVKIPIDNLFQKYYANSISTAIDSFTDTLHLDKTSINALKKHLGVLGGS